MVNNTAGSVSVLDNDARPEIRPSANSAVLIDLPDGDTIEIIEGEFEEDNEEEVKLAVERWVEEQVARIEKCIRAEFGA